MAQAGDFRVTFINPGGTSGFWGDVSATMAAAADDLNVDLEILNADRRTYGMETLLSQRLKQGNPPDYFILVNEYEVGARLLQQLEGTPSKVLFLLNKLSPKQRVILDRRKVDLRRIIAAIDPDNETAGYEMAMSLFKQERLLHPEGADIHLLALTGDTQTPAGLFRSTGMQRAVADSPDVTLMHSIPVNWSEQVAYARTRAILKKRKVDAVWAASDAVALGASRAAAEMGLAVGKDIFFAGLNWSKRGMDAVKRGEMTMSHGGHFFAGAWAIVLLRDHFFRPYDSEIYVNVRFKMQPITPDNVALYLDRLGDGDWSKLDYRSFSKTLTGRSNYDFSAEAILNAASIN